MVSSDIGVEWLRGVGVLQVRVVFTINDAHIHYVFMISNLLGYFNFLLMLRFLFMTFCDTWPPMHRGLCSMAMVGLCGGKALACMVLNNVHE